MRRLLCTENEWMSNDFLGIVGAHLVTLNDQIVLPGIEYGTGNEQLYGVPGLFCRDGNRDFGRAGLVEYFGAVRGKAGVGRDIDINAKRVVRRNRDFHGVTAA